MYFSLQHYVISLITVSDIDPGGASENTEARVSVHFLEDLVVFWALRCQECVCGAGELTALAQS